MASICRKWLKGHIVRHFFVINPAAGKGKGVDELTATIKSACEKREEKYEIYYTASIGDAKKYVNNICCLYKASGEALRFYACGGDGTVNEVASGLVGFENVELAIIPIGTGNDFVRNFSHSEGFFDIDAQLDGAPVSCDMITVNDGYCINISNIGFDCEVVKHTSRLKTSPLIPAKLAYIAGLIFELVKKTGVEFDLYINGEHKGKRRLLLSLFANGCFYGGGFLAAPYSSYNDGYIDVCTIQYVSRLTFISLVNKYKCGRHLLIKSAGKYFEYYKCREVVLDFGKEQSICIDGELASCDKLCIGILPGAIKVSLPKGSADRRSDIPMSPVVETAEERVVESEAV